MQIISSTLTKCSCYVLLMDFEKKHRDRTNGMVFAPYKDRMIADLGRADAMAVLHRAVESTYNEDMRTDEVKAALDYLRRGAVRQAFFDNFWNGLDIQEPKSRWQNLNAALNGICRQFGQ